VAGAQLAPPAAPAPPAKAGVAVEAPLDAWTRYAYGVGDIPNAVKMVTAALFGFFFYTSVMGLPARLVGLAGAIGLVWDAVIDPYVGHLSDRARLRLGRRHGFMLVGALTMGLGFWMSFSPPRGLSQGALFAWLLATGFLVRTATSIYRVPYFALGAELSRDYDQRTRITGLRGILGITGSLVAAPLAFVLFFPARGSGDPKLRYEGYPELGLAFGAVMTAFALVATLGTRARAHAGATAAAGAPPRHFLSASRQCLRNRSFRVLLGSSSLFFLAVSMTTTLSIHFHTYYARVTDSRALAAVQLAFYGTSVVGMMVWLRVSRRLEKHHLYVLGTGATGALMVALPFLVGEGRPLGTGNVPALVAGHALVGFFASTLWFVPATLLADVVDEDELATGARREGAFFGLWSFGQQLATGAAMLLTGVLVDGYAGLVPGQAVQSAQTVERIGLLYSALPGALLLVAAAWGLGYRIGRQDVMAMQRELDLRRGA
jgi:GPH family glycoside/pentoside/hexuronide:cation symporter